MTLKITYRIPNDKRNRKRTILCCPGSSKCHGTVHPTLEKAKQFAQKHLGKYRGKVIVERPLWTYG